MNRIGLLALASLAPSLVALAPSVARAETVPLIGVTGGTVDVEPQQSYRSSQHFAFELKMGQYSPDIDSTPGLTGKPFSELWQNQFGSSVGQRPAGKLLTTLEFDWQIWHGFGSIGLAASVGLMSTSTHSFQYNADGTPCSVPSCTRSADSTTLNVLPFALEAVYRFDVLALKWRIPVVPYLKGGIGYYLWFIQNGGGGLSQSLPPPSGGKPATTANGSDQGIGGTFGLVAHPGLALMLDLLDPTAARAMDTELGINHSYLFIELHYAWITGFGNSSRMVLSDVDYNIGLAFEF